MNVLSNIPFPTVHTTIVENWKKHSISKFGDLYASNGYFEESKNLLSSVLALSLIITV